MLLKDFTAMPHWSLLRMKTIWRVSSYLFAHKGLFWSTQALAVAMTLLAISIPNQIRKILNGLEHGGSEALMRGVAIIAGLYLLREVFNSLRIRINNTLEQRVLLTMRRDLHTKLLHLPTSFYDTRKSGEISSRVIEDVTNVERALLDGTEQGLSSILLIIGVTAVLFSLQPFLAWFVFLPVPVLLIMGVIYARGSRKVWRKVREAAGDLNSLLVEDIQGNRLIQTFGLQRREAGRFEEKAETLRVRTLRAMFRWSIYGPTTNFITSLGVVAVLGIGGHLILTQSTEFGFPELIAFFIYAVMLYEPIGRLHGLNHMLSAGKSSGDRVFEILDQQVEITDCENPVSFPPGSVGISFKEVDFRYPDRSAVLDNFTLDIPAGKVTALVGHTGAGKSTIANLAMRVYDVSSGSITLNGVELKSIALADLHNNIGHVAQDPFLFEGTVADNLLLAREGATKEQVIEALKGASAWEFVKRLPNGIDTNIGEKGIRLSQGEKQRLTIARVLLKNPPIVILDEATASVDTITERQIQQALENLTRERTVLVIAHRLSTIRKADKIVVMERGRIVETGVHDELLYRNGPYANLWLHQVDVFQDEENPRSW